jgi:hypothetical protein
VRSEIFAVIPGGRRDEIPVPGERGRRHEGLEGAPVKESQYFPGGRDMANCPITGSEERETTIRVRLGGTPAYFPAPISLIRLNNSRKSWRIGVLNFKFYFFDSVYVSLPHRNSEKAFRLSHAVFESLGKFMSLVVTCRFF